MLTLHPSIQLRWMETDAVKFQKKKKNPEITCVLFSKSSKSYIAYLCMKQTEIKYTLVI